HLHRIQDSSQQVNPYLSSHSPRSDVMGAAESGKEIVKRNPVRQIDDRNLLALLALVSMEQIVVPDRQIE
ncbi:MAG TPA: hypothetical protein VGU90_11990, partial [Terriglobales bacterium]|nr:hypothetical protein [Terriglobales bacterium]